MLSAKDGEILPAPSALKESFVKKRSSPWESGIVPPI